MRVGVLALQGDFAEHIRAVDSSGAEGVTAFAARSREDVEAADALILPGGESTTMLKLVDRYELRELMCKRIESGVPVFGTCAGAILLADEVSDGEPPLGVVPLTITRNAYGRQVESFEADIDVDQIEGGPVHGVFIRAPVIDEVRGDGRVMATYNDAPVLVRYENILVSTFHPELTPDRRIHRFFLEELAR